MIVCNNSVPAEQGVKGVAVMKNITQKLMLIVQVTLWVILSGMSMASSAALVGLSDQELGVETGQALFNLSYLSPSDLNNPMKDTGVGFYTLGAEGTLALNANIKNLQLGCGGVNGAGGCDIDAQNVSFGCVANASGVCTSLAPVTQANGVVQTAGALSDAAGNQQQLKDFTLTNPFLQIAIKNPQSASTRQVVGVRLGAGSAVGPLSFGNLVSLSGYLSGTSDIIMRGQGPNQGGVTGNGTLAPTPAENANDLLDVAVTCKTPDICPNTAGRSDYTGMANYRYLGLDDAQVCLIPVIACANFKQLTVNYKTVVRNGLPVLAAGTRVTQAFISNSNLGNGTNVINGVSQDGVVKAIGASMSIVRTSSAFGAGLLNLILPAIVGSATSKIDSQLAAGLGTTTAALDNNTYKIPYNLSNVHQLDIDTTKPGAGFGLSLQSQSIQYPGYAQSVNTGWALYAANSFGLPINSRVTDFVQNIALSSNAANGNIIGLAPAYRNCYGSLKFC